MFLLDVDLFGRFLSMHDDFAAQFGYQSEEMLGRPLSEMVPPQDHAELWSLVHGAILGNRLPGYIRFRMECADGSYLWVERLAAEGRARMRVLGPAHLARGAKIPSFSLKPGPRTGTAWVSVDVDENGHTSIFYSAGITNGQLSQLLFETLDPATYRRLQRFVFGLMVSDVADFPVNQTALADDPYVEGNVRRQ